MDNSIPYTISGATPYSTLFMVPPWFQENGISTREGKELEGKKKELLFSYILSGPLGNQTIAPIHLPLQQLHVATRLGIQYIY